LAPGSLRARGVDFACVVATAPLRIGKKVVRAGNILEPFLGVLVAGIEVRMLTNPLILADSYWPDCLAISWG